MDQGKLLKIDKPQKLIESVSKIYKLSFFVSKEIPEDFFAGIKGITKLHKEHPQVMLEIESVEIFPEIINRLKMEEIGYSLMNLKTASLEDVYLQLTGHEYQD